MDNTEVDQSIRAVLTSLGPALTFLDHKSVESFLNFGELGLAAETLCDQISERRATPTRETYEALAKLTAHLQLEPRYIESVPKPAA
jgi:hypothetical protein